MDRDISGKLKPRKRILYRHDPGCTEGAQNKYVSIVDKMSWQKQQPRLPHLVAEKTNNATCYNPWGKPGGGAPLCSADGKVKASLPRRKFNPIKKSVSFAVSREKMTKQTPPRSSHSK